ncbi:MAG: hypothetical protein COA77_01390 [Thaumarchaeota archaeon]|nr:MAG: hypothetical protein COA77_01390 [Nitrososphaerota archaeon]
MNQEYTLLSVIDKFGTVPGKKALHKITYFTNLQTDDFIYRWNNYGPYSEEVQQFFDDAYLNDNIAVDEIQLNNVARQYNTSLTEQGTTRLEYFRNINNENYERINSSIDFAYNLLNEKNPRQMEILASVHYIINYDCTFDSERILEIINQLKPQSHFTLEEVTEALTILHGVQLA